MADRIVLWNTHSVSVVLSNDGSTVELATNADAVVLALTPVLVVASTASNVDLRAFAAAHG